MGSLRNIAQGVATACIATAFALNFTSAAVAGAFPADRAGLDAYIHDYLMKNPQVLRDALLKLDAEAQTANAKRVLTALKGEIYGAGSPEIGNPKAKVTIV